MPRPFRSGALSRALAVALGAALLALVAAAPPAPGPPLVPPPATPPVAPTAGGAKDCDTCESLCWLVEEYAQRDMGEALWWKYASALGEPIPNGVNDLVAMEHHVEKEFQDWANARGPSGLACASLPRGGATVTRLQTSFDCKILDAAGRPLVGKVRDDFVASRPCRQIAEAAVAHEQVHAKHCLDTWAAFKDQALKMIDTPTWAAESEAQAWREEKEQLGKAIRDVLAKHGCGWDTTARKIDRDSIPTPGQTRELEATAWGAADALSPDWRH